MATRHPRRAVPDLTAQARRATSSAEDVPRTLDFLYSRNRLNVAVSRARCAWPASSPAPAGGPSRTRPARNVLRKLANPDR